MSIETSNAVERILTLERKFFRLRKNIDDLVAWRVPGAEQQLAISWAVAGRRGCTTTFTGKVVGSPALGATELPGSSIRIVGRQSGLDYGTFSLPLGTYSIDLILDPADFSFDLYAIGPGTRFNQSPAPVTQYLQTSQCRPTTFAPITCTPATGYRYWSGPCSFPVATTLNWTSSLHGSGTLIWQAFSDTWQSGGAGSFPTYAYGICPARPSIPLSFSTPGTTATGGLPPGCFAVSYPGDAFRCPNASGGIGSVESYSRVLIASPQCADVATKFDMTYAIPGGTGAIFGPSNQTFRIWEP
ncbi:hypothetical protein [Singulisphaera acidiphila]|uniref:Uncharacterized protein n=1 Tax=Singulisphaera acidiphila (strain ATCC BAA-1392 / DSM 18658 / VKM B-2454 / MOB10) TaxID=886293 RepID=L0DG93_SINAD|nr:hypothetical protein [Singulisphaera acidiphila]AGA28374.1 hypothetical protein Sinac_4167 [Singulisphaera acidiphila DSM 18658]